MVGIVLLPLSHTHIDNECALRHLPESDTRREQRRKKNDTHYCKCSIIQTDKKTTLHSLFILYENRVISFDSFLVFLFSFLHKNLNHKNSRNEMASCFVCCGYENVIEPVFCFENGSIWQILFSRKTI